MSLKNFCLKIDGFIFTAIVCFLVESLKMDFFYHVFHFVLEKKMLGGRVSHEIQLYEI